MINKCVRFLKETQIFYFCTCDDKPHCRPFATVAKINGDLCFATSNLKTVYKELVANPYVQIVGCKPSAEWIRISGKAVVDNSIPMRRAMFRACPVLYNLYKDVADNGFLVFHVEDLIVEFF
jgi:uncharacterized pyridoxamine 5'-phosphate oxidase family protein